MQRVATTPEDVEVADSSGRRAVRLAVAAAWTAVICVLCWMPRDMVHRVEEDSSWFRVPNLDKVVHWGIFVVFAVLWLRVGSSRWRFATVAVAGLALAVLTELGQRLPAVGRDATVGDAVTDMIGVAIGLGVARWVEPVLSRVESLVFGARGARSIGG